jgi:hypothetical protein
MLSKLRVVCPGGDRTCARFIGGAIEELGDIALFFMIKEESECNVK